MYHHAWLSLSPPDTLTIPFTYSCLLSGPAALALAGLPGQLLSLLLHSQLGPSSQKGLSGVCGMDLVAQRVYFKYHPKCTDTNKRSTCPQPWLSQWNVKGLPREDLQPAHLGEAKLTHLDAQANWSSSSGEFPESQYPHFLSKAGAGGGGNGD